MQGIYPGEGEINESGEAVTVSSMKSPRSRGGESGGRKKKGQMKGRDGKQIPNSQQKGVR